MLEVFEKRVEGHINVQIQFNLDDMKDYCSKETNFISKQYLVKIYKHQWRVDFLERKPQLKEVLDNLPDDRTVDWIIDAVGNSYKSSFA